MIAEKDIFILAGPAPSNPSHDEYNHTKPLQQGVLLQNDKRFRSYTLNHRYFLSPAQSS